MFALPMETAAHPDTLTTREEGDPLQTVLASPPIRPGDPSPDGYGKWYLRGSADTETKHVYRQSQDLINRDRYWILYNNQPPLDPADIINWVRVYKNPKTSPATVTGNVATGVSALAPSLHWEENVPGWRADQAIWVDFNTMSGDGSLSPDPDKDDSETGLVTADKNTTVKPGDRVAIAVNITTWGGGIWSDMAIGPRVDITYQFQSEEWTLEADGVTEKIHPVTGRRYRTWQNLDLTQHEGVWRLNPNLPLSGYSGRLQTHTLVYQFVVGEEHAILNKGPWLKRDFVYAADTGSDPKSWFNPGTGRTEGVHLLPGGPQPGNRRDPIDWLYGRPDGTLPSATAVKLWNTLVVTDTERLSWGSTATNNQSPGWSYHRWANNSDYTRSHRHIPMYEPEQKELIYYPKVVVGNTDVTTVSSSTAITDVPSGTQTGAFQVTLEFSEVQEINDFMVSRVTFDEVKSTTTGGPYPAVLTAPPWRSDIPVSGASVSIFVAHDVSEAGVDDFKEELTTALAAADPPWTVTALTYAGGIKLASLEGHGPATRYTLTLSPPLNVKGDVALQIPAGVVSDAAGNPNVASETVMISVDTKTALPLAVVDAPEVVSRHG